MPTKEQMDFNIGCGTTTLGDGTILDNKERAPLFIIEELERRTGLTRPAEAERYSLEDIELFFTSGGMMEAPASRLLPEIKK